MRGSIPGSHALELAEFVQVKKPRQYRDRWIGSWTIETKQLKDLLMTSQSAVYWLIDPSGDVLVVPAKLLGALAPKRAGRTFTVGFNSVRSAAIMIDQFLAELLVGGWLGNERDQAKRIARGEVAGLVPKYLVELQVGTGQQE